MRLCRCVEEINIMIYTPLGWCTNFGRICWVLISMFTSLIEPGGLKHEMRRITMISRPKLIQPKKITQNNRHYNTKFNLRINRISFNATGNNWVFYEILFLRLAHIYTYIYIFSLQTPEFCKKKNLSSILLITFCWDLIWKVE